MRDTNIVKLILYEVQQEELILLMLLGQRNQESDNSAS